SLGPPRQEKKAPGFPQHLAKGMIRFPSEIEAVSKRGVVAAFLLLAVAAGAWYWTSWRRSDSDLSSLRLRIGELSGRVEKERAASAEAAEKSRPQDKGKVDDLGRPAADLLRQLPGVVSVEVVPATGKPTRRLAHLRAWHHVPRDLLAIELRSLRGR